MGYNYYLLKLINGITGNIYRNDRVKEIDLRANKKELVYKNAAIGDRNGIIGLTKAFAGRRIDLQESSNHNFCNYHILYMRELYYLLVY
jgi:hypothetical protein